MSNKTTIGLIILGGVIASLILRAQRRKQEDTERTAMEESMNRVKEIFNDAFSE